MGADDLGGRAELATLAGRLAHEDVIDARIQAWTGSRDAREAMVALQEAGVPAGVAQTVEDKVRHDPQLAFRGLYKTLDDPVLGTKRYEDVPVTMSGLEVGVASPSPWLGADTRDVLRGLLGYSEERARAAQGERDHRRRDHAGGGAAGMTGTLAHLTVVELAGPRTEWCGKLFSQAGARVVLVEPPGGAETRGYAPWFRGREDSESSLHFWHYNTDKEGIALDLSAEEGRAAFLRLLAEADILLDGSEVGELAGLGLTREAIAGANERLVHVALTPFGQEGPMASWRGSDLVHQALGGQMMSNGYDDMPASPPINGQGNQAGHMAGSWAFIAALAALQAGKGTFIDLSMHDTCAGMTENALPQYDYTGKVVTRRTGRHASIAPTPAWQHRAADGRYINAQLVNVSPRAWEGLVSWLDEHGMAEDLIDPKYFVPEIFRDEADHISAVIGRFVATKTADEIFHGAQARALIFSAILNPEDLLDDPHLAARDFWIELDHGEPEGMLRYAGSAFVAEHSEVRPRRRAPHLDEHGEAIRGEVGDA